MSTTKEWQKTPVRQRVLGAEAELIRMQGALDTAKLDFEVAARTYAVLRDMFKERFGESPYTGSWAAGMAYTYGPNEDDVASYGLFRYIHMTMGTAVVEALKHLGPTESIPEIVDHLEEGGLGASEGAAVSPRAVNAALRRTTGVERDAQGRYYVEGYTEGPDATPF